MPMFEKLWIQPQDFDSDDWKDPEIRGWLLLLVIYTSLCIIFNIASVYQVPYVNADLKFLVSLPSLLGIYTLVSLCLRWRNAVLGRSETPVLEDEGNPVLYTEGAMTGRPKYKIKHNRKRENLNLYIWLHPRSQQERTQNRNTLSLAEKIRFEREQEFLEDREGYRLKKEKEVDLLRYFRKHRDDEIYSRPIRVGFGTAYRRFIAFLESVPKYNFLKVYPNIRGMPIFCGWTC